MRLKIIGIITVAGMLFGATAIVAGQAGTPQELKMKEKNEKTLSVEEELNTIVKDGINKGKECKKHYFHKNTIKNNVSRLEHVTIFELADKDKPQDVVIEFISIWVIMADATPIRPFVIESLNPATGKYEDFIYPELKFVGEQTWGKATHYNWTVALHTRIKAKSLRMSYSNPGIDVRLQDVTFRTVVNGYLIGSECP